MSDAEPGFEDALRDLERHVAELEAGDLGLDDALARYERGVRLLARCHALLDGAGRKVELLTGVDDQGRATTEPFDAAATAPRETPPDGSSPSGRMAADDGVPF